MEVHEKIIFPFLTNHLKGHMLTHTGSALFGAHIRQLRQRRALLRRPHHLLLGDRRPRHQRHQGDHLPEAMDSLAQRTPRHGLATTAVLCNIHHYAVKLEDDFL